MGKSSKPLRILLLNPEWVEWEEIKALQAQGHTIGMGGPEWIASWDLILGSQCWHFRDEMRPYLQMALEGAKRIRYPKKKGEKE